MRIIVAGIGEVGTHLATMLSGAYHSVIAIDPNEENLEQLRAHADVVTVEGSASSILTLEKAGIDSTDLFIAVAQIEETNIVAAVLAKKLGAKRVLARIDNNEYLTGDRSRLLQELGIDRLIYPEKLASLTLIGMLGETGTSESVDFANGKMQLSAFPLTFASPIVGLSLKSAARCEWQQPFRIVALVREGRTIVPNGDEVLQGGDQLYVISTPLGITEWRKLLGGDSFTVKRLMVVGASRIGLRTCLDLEEKVSRITLIEQNESKCRQIGPLLKRTLLLNADGRDSETLLREGLEQCDAFVAVTGHSETNVLVSMVAKKAGVRQIIAEVENLDYIALAQSVGIHNVINKKLIAASHIYRYTLADDIHDLKCLTGTDAEVLEFVVQPNSPATRGRIKDLNFPKGAIAGGLLRGATAEIVTGNTQIEAGDRVVVFALPGSRKRLDRFFLHAGKSLASQITAWFGRP